MGINSGFKGLNKQHVVYARVLLISVQVALASNYLLRRKSSVFFLCTITFRGPQWGAAFTKAGIFWSMYVTTREKLYKTKNTVKL